MRQQALYLHDALRVPSSASKQTHIVLMLDQFPKAFGGGERVVLRRAGLLTRAGYRVSIVTFAILCDPTLLANAPCPIYLLPLRNVFRPEALLAAWQLGRFLRKQRVQIVETFFESSNLFGGIATKALSSARLVWNRRDMGILRAAKHRLAYRLLPGLPDAVIAVSDQVRQHAIVEDHISAERVHVIYNGLPADQWSAAENIAGKAPRIVAVGNIRPVKGHDVLIAAAAPVLQQHPDAEFVIAGEILDPECFRALQASAAALGIADRITFAGNVSDPGTLLRSASIFVLPSRSEGFSNAIVEAMMASLPVVATTVGGNAEAVLQGETGLLVPPEDPAALADALSSLLCDLSRSEQMGRAGRLRAEALFSDKGTLQQTISLYDRLLR